MKILLRPIGNSLGVIVPRKTLKAWGLRQGDALELTEAGIRPPHVRRNRQEQLDRFKRALALEVLKRHTLSRIRERSLANLDRWKETGVWNAAYETWRQVLEKGRDADLLALMAGDDERANQMRQSMPFVGLLSEDIRNRLLEEAAG